MHFDSYVICGTPRSGSTMLCDLLRDTGVAGRPASYFRTQSIDDYAQKLQVPTRETWNSPSFDLAYLEAVKERARNGTPVTGIRLMYENLANVLQRLRLFFPDVMSDVDALRAAFGRVLFISLTRDDRLHQAISRVKAIQTGLWHMGSDGSERERIGAPKDPWYDEEAIAYHLQELDAHYAGWANWFERQGLQPIAIGYEELTTNPQETVAMVLEALGQNPSIADTLAPRTARLADDLSQEWANRFRQARLSSSR